MFVAAPDRLPHVAAKLVYGDRSLSLTPLDYEFADKTKSLVGVGEAHWLSIKVQAADGAERWERIDPCFSDVELHGLVRWLRSLESGNSGRSTFEGIEPSLQFSAQWMSDQVQFEARFCLELHPSGLEGSGTSDQKVIWMELPRTAIEEFADCLADELRPFPDPRPASKGG